MGTLAISPKAYGDLLAKTLPKVIETDRELEHFAKCWSRWTDWGVNCGRKKIQRAQAEGLRHIDSGK